MKHRAWGIRNPGGDWFGGLGQEGLVKWRADLSRARLLASPAQVEAYKLKLCARGIEFFSIIEVGIVAGQS